VELITNSGVLAVQGVTGIEGEREGGARISVGSDE
jgi:hypothetical protein